MGTVIARRSLINAAAATLPVLAASTLPVRGQSASDEACDIISDLSSNGYSMGPLTDAEVDARARFIFDQLPVIRQTAADLRSHQDAESLWTQIEIGTAVIGGGLAVAAFIATGIPAMVISFAGGAALTVGRPIIDRIFLGDSDAVSRNLELSTTLGSLGLWRVGDISAAAGNIKHLGTAARNVGFGAGVAGAAVNAYLAVVHYRRADQLGQLAESLDAFAAAADQELINIESSRAVFTNNWDALNHALSEGWDAGCSVAVRRG